jgi:hypothetical protein
MGKPVQPTSFIAEVAPAAGNRGPEYRCEARAGLRSANFCASVPLGEPSQAVGSAPWHQFNNLA